MNLSVLLYYFLHLPIHPSWNLAHRRFSVLVSWSKIKLVNVWFRGEVLMISLCYYYLAEQTWVMWYRLWLRDSIQCGHHLLIQGLEWPSHTEQSHRKVMGFSSSSRHLKSKTSKLAIFYSLSLEWMLKLLIHLRQYFILDQPSLSWWNWSLLSTTLIVCSSV